MQSKEIGLQDEGWEGFLLGFRMGRMRAFFQMEGMPLWVREYSKFQLKR